MAALRAAFTTGSNRARLSAIEQFVFLRENDSEAAANTATSVAPAARAASNPCRFGTSTGYEVAGPRLMRAITDALSAICGTHFGDTNAVASIAVKPVRVNRSISSTLMSVGTMPFSFCRPSRGPTSTSFTRAGSAMMQSADVHEARGHRVSPRAPVFERAMLSALQEVHELRTFGDLLTHREAESLDPAVGGCSDRVLHLHRFEDQQRRILLDVRARLGQPGH